MIIEYASQKHLSSLNLQTRPSKAQNWTIKFILEHSFAGGALKERRRTGSLLSYGERWRKKSMEKPRENRTVFLRYFFRPTYVYCRSALSPLIGESVKTFRRISRLPCQCGSDYWISPAKNNGLTMGIFRSAENRKEINTSGALIEGFVRYVKVEPFSPTLELIYFMRACRMVRIFRFLNIWCLILMNFEILFVYELYQIKLSFTKDNLIWLYWKFWVWPWEYSIKILILFTLKLIIFMWKVL